MPRRGDIVDILLLRTIHRLNRYIKPDVTIFPGDLADNADSVEGRNRLRAMRKTIDLLDSPTIVLPGNHDGNVDLFYKIFDEPPDLTDINGYRFVSFTDDPEEPNWNARRLPENLRVMRVARRGFTGPIIALQHVCLHPPDINVCPYNYTNADDIITEMRNNDIFFSIASHFHAGFDVVEQNGINYFCAPALCESPFPFTVIDINDRDITVARHQLAIPEGLDLVDRHIHTQFAYCGENMDIQRAANIADGLGLAGFGFAEHSGQLYFRKRTYWSGKAYLRGMRIAKPRNNRMTSYFETAAKLNLPPGSVGLEVDIDIDGNPLLHDKDRARAGYLLGSVHYLREFSKRQPDYQTICDEFLALTEKLLTSGIDILAHPLRIFPRANLPYPNRVLEPLVRLLRENKVAAEINFHGNQPPVDFVQLCLNAGVRLAFGSDSHNLYEIGEFTPHIAMLRQCGYSGDFSDILLQPATSPPAT